MTWRNNQNPRAGNLQALNTCRLFADPELFSKMATAFEL
jgi:hypothetical protein